jgi:competence protein ComEC
MAVERNGIIVYNNNKNPLLHIVGTNGDNWLISTVPQLDAEYEHASLPYIKRERLDVPVWVDTCFSSSCFEHDEGLVTYEGLKVRLVADERWQESLYSVPTDVVILCRGFLGKIEELVEVYPPGCILLDASLYKRSRERIMRECAVLGIEAIDVSKTGAVKIVPRGDSFEILPMRGK